MIIGNGLDGYLHSKIIYQKKYCGIKHKAITLHPFPIEKNLVACQQ